MVYERDLIMATKEEIMQTLSSVKHPAINYSLIELGIIKDVSLEDKKAKVLIKLPFPNIPIKAMLINSIEEPILEMGLEFEYELQLMNEEEKQHFLFLETKGWRI